MHGRPALLIALFTAASGLVAACGGDPPVPELTDPREILAAAAATTTAARSVHVEVRADGSLAIDVTGSGVGAAIELEDSTASADLSMEAGAGRVTFALPGLLGLRGEIITTDGTTYVKTTLTGPLYQAIAPGDGAGPAPGGSPDPDGADSVLRLLTDVITHPDLTPVKGADVDCAGTRCYTVAITVTPAQLAGLVNDGLDLPDLSGGLPIPVPLPDLTGATIGLTIHVQKATGRLDSIAADIAGGAIGAATVGLTFSRWDESVSIVAPPPDQVRAGG